VLKCGAVLPTPAPKKNKKKVCTLLCGTSKVAKVGSRARVKSAKVQPQAASHKKVFARQKGLRSAGGPKLLKWGLSGRGSNLLKSDRPLTPSSRSRLGPRGGHGPFGKGNPFLRWFKSTSALLAPPLPPTPPSCKRAGLSPASPGADIIFTNISGGGRAQGARGGRARLCAARRAARAARAPRVPCSQSTVHSLRGYRTGFLPSRGKGCERAEKPMIDSPPVLV